ncbi:proline-rich protein HaeIII subfamily 1-like [Rhinolophus ferrumequinum]|uniref:proline-rich protein HaeIII subfamily 1-like n=1 Tax=Rhinolophus ferrumequinum TaxID=59479 RepID=UPI00140FEE0A|nr:proline-rich protein HaeIII subfamily 1-like [Rhinolophus ferrumequinum]
MQPLPSHHPTPRLGRGSETSFLEALVSLRAPQAAAAVRWKETGQQRLPAQGRRSLTEAGAPQGAAGGRDPAPPPPRSPPATLGANRCCLGLICPGQQVRRLPARGSSAGPSHPRAPRARPSPRPLPSSRPPPPASAVRRPPLSRSPPPLRP